MHSSQNVTYPPDLRLAENRKRQVNSLTNLHNKKLVVVVLDGSHPRVYHFCGLEFDRNSSVVT